jgi:hypothetical protein
MHMRFAASCLVALNLVVFPASQASYAQDKMAPANSSAPKFVNFPGLPTCLKGAVQNGDPMGSGFVILAKATTGCVVPWHWHSANEQLMMVTGSAKVGMKDAAPASLHAAGYVNLPAKNAHQFTCAVACTFFIMSDAAFDIHYVDKDGKEISPDEALKSKAKAPMKKEMKDMKDMKM